MNDATIHLSKWHDSWKIINELEGDESVCQNTADGKVAWKFISECDEDIFESMHMRELEVTKNMFNPMIKDESKYSEPNDPDYCDCYWGIRPASVDKDLEKMNEVICEDNTKNIQSYKRSIRLVTKDEYLIFHALMIGLVMYVQQGAQLWKDDCKNIKNKREGLLGDINFGKYTKWWRFKQVKYYFPVVMEDTKMRDGGVDWWKFKDHITKKIYTKSEKYVHHMY